MTGTLYGLGVGPGDPELITLKALRLLQAAPVVAYPAPDDGPSFARAIVAGHLEARRGAPPVEVPIIIPMRAARFPAQQVYDHTAEVLADHLTQGRDVAVLCEGDPFFYGSFMYLFGRLADRFPTEVVPGVSSMMTCAAAIGTQRLADRFAGADGRRQAARQAGKLRRRRGDEARTQLPQGAQAV